MSAKGMETHSRCRNCFGFCLNCWELSLSSSPRTRRKDSISPQVSVNHVDSAVFAAAQQWHHVLIYIPEKCAPRRECMEQLVMAAGDSTQWDKAQSLNSSFCIYPLCVSKEELYTKFVLSKESEALWYSYSSSLNVNARRYLLWGLSWILKENEQVWNNLLSESKEQGLFFFTSESQSTCNRALCIQLYKYLLIDGAIALFHKAGSGSGIIWVFESVYIQVQYFSYTELLMFLSQNNYCYLPLKEGN